MAERILVVEDERTLCTNVARYLSRAGYTVTAVESGRAALSELGRTTFDLVITDLRLPDLSGLDVLDHVRATSPESFVLIMTAYASVESAVEALRRGPTTTFSSRCRSPTCGRRSSTSPSTIASIERTLGCACCAAAVAPWASSATASRRSRYPPPTSWSSERAAPARSWSLARCTSAPSAHTARS